MRAFSVKAIVSPTTTSPHNRYRLATLASSNCAIGVVEPKRYSMQGSAKNSTKPFRPGIASSGSMRRWAAIKPASTSAKKGKVTSRMLSTVGDCLRITSGHRACRRQGWPPRPAGVAGIIRRFAECLR
ncbi:hypothetical protein D9M68_901600 [compost metagenome]